jgi:hypothetical protein
VRDVNIFLKQISGETLHQLIVITKAKAEVLIMKAAKRREKLQARQEDYQKMIDSSKSDIFKKHGEAGFHKPGSVKQ